MTSKMTIPLKGAYADYTKARFDYSEFLGVDFNGLRIDHIAKVGDHLEAAYTVTSKELIKKLLATPRVECSMG